MIGSGPMSDKLKRTASESVNFFGHVSDGEKRQLMGRAHALLATSVREGWGLTVTEAVAVGTATIGYAVPGLVDSIAASGGTWSLRASRNSVMRSSVAYQDSPMVKMEVLFIRQGAELGRCGH